MVKTFRLRICEALTARSGLSLVSACLLFADVDQAYVADPPEADALPGYYEFFMKTGRLVRIKQEIERFGVYLVDKAGRIRVCFKGTKTARPRLDQMLTELARINGGGSPGMQDADEKIVADRDGLFSARRDGKNAETSGRWEGWKAAGGVWVGKLVG